VRRSIITDEHETFREMATSFFTREAIPNVGRWEAEGKVDREFFEKAGEIGLLGIQVPEQFGGTGLKTYTYNMVVSEAAASVGFVPINTRLHTDVVLPYYLRYATQEQRQRWLPGMVAGKLIGAIAMSEPDTGSDLAGIGTRADRCRDVYRLKGAKTFITSGAIADLVIVVARTSRTDNRREGLTLLVVERGMDGFSRGRTLNKLGLKYSDTAELFFDDVEVPVANRLGEEGQAFSYLGANLPQERLSISVGAVAMGNKALADTVAYAKDRKLFGTTLGSLQNTKFVLAEVATELAAAQQFLDRAVEDHDAGLLTPADAAKVKLFCTEVQGRAVDKCLQVHGGFGYVHDYPIASMYADARVTRIYGGSSEVMKVIVSRSLGL